MDDDLDTPLGRPTYKDVLADNRRLREENARLKQRIAQLERQVEEMLRLVEKLRGEGKRRAAPFRKQDQPAAPAKKPGRKSGKNHGRHAHRSVLPVDCRSISDVRGDSVQHVLSDVPVMRQRK